MVVLSTIVLAALLFFSVLAGIRDFNIRLTRALHILQLEDYDPIRMIQSLFRQINFVKIFSYELFGIVLIVGVIIFIGTLHGRIGIDRGELTLIALVSFSLIGFIFWHIGSRQDQRRIKLELDGAKKKLVVTARAKRLKLNAILVGMILLTPMYLTGLLFYLFLYNKIAHPIDHPVLSPFLSLSPFFRDRIGSLIVPMAIFQFVPLTVYLLSRLVSIILTVSVILSAPMEKLIQWRFMQNAKSILNDFKPLVIGITGSYGKTSVKEILAVLLASKFNVLKPPGSFNTLMGITRLIREQLRHYHEVFIVEMGAYREGSIDKLCRLTEPTHGLITIIGLQHLERFKTQNSIQRAKGELIRALPVGGTAVLNADDPLSCEIGNDFAGKVIYFSMIGSHQAKEVVFVSNPKLSVQGSTFDVNFPDGSSVTISLPLLGRAAIINTVAAIAMADSLGVGRHGMRNALAGMPQVRHRLELIRRADGVNIIDDAFNSNPIGAAHALEVLSKGTSGRRILITPGMVELGEAEEAANREFGSLAAESCDLAILVGAQRIKPIENGMIKAGFATENIWIVSSFLEGMKRLEPELKAGDTILIENDLPDQYDNL